MKIKLLLISISIFGLKHIQAQQLADFTLSRENYFNYNPAVAGSEEKNILYVTARKEWTKIKGSPMTVNLAYHMPLKNKHIGIGGYFFNDFTGPTSYTGVNLSFAYHIIFSEYSAGVSERKTLGFGVSASAVQYRINGSKIQLDQPEDNAIYSYKGSQFYPDAAFGIYYKSKKVEAGLSVPQLLHLDVPVMARQTGAKSTLKKMQHYYGYFTYKFLLNPRPLNDRRHYLEPSINLHYVINAPFQGVATVRYNYDNVFFAELGYRSLSTMVFGAGVTIAEKFSVAYAYDFNFSRVRQNLGSVHELQLKFAFDEYTFRKQ